MQRGRGGEEGGGGGPGFRRRKEKCKIDGILVRTYIFSQKIICHSYKTLWRRKYITYTKIHYPDDNALDRTKHITSKIHYLAKYIIKMEIH